jgi:hypothetical protein
VRPAAVRDSASAGFVQHDSDCGDAADRHEQSEGRADVGREEFLQRQHWIQSVLAQPEMKHEQGRIAPASAATS